MPPSAAADLVRQGRLNLAAMWRRSGQPVVHDAAARTWVLGTGAQQRMQPRLQFREIEGLGQVVVGPGVEAGHAVVQAVQRGEHQHRHRHAGGAGATQHGEAVHHRQAQVQDGEFVRLLQQQVFGHGAVGRVLDLKSGALELR